MVLHQGKIEILPDVSLNIKKLSIVIFSATGASERIIVVDLSKQFILHSIDSFFTDDRYK